MNASPLTLLYRKSAAWLCAVILCLATATTGLAAGIVSATTQYSASRIAFDNTQTQVGGAVFGNAGTYDGIPFSLWSTPYTTANSLGSGVSVVAGGFNANTALGLSTDGQYRQVAYSSSNAAGSLTFSGLDSSKQYKFQIAFCDRRPGSFPYSVTATLTLSDATTATTPLAIGAAPTGDDYALITVTVSGSTSLKLDLPQATSGIGPLIAGFSVHSLPPPPAPTGLAATAANQTVALSWTASAGATGYNVKRSTTSGSGYTTVGTTAGTSYNDGGLTNGTPYYYVVAATNASGEGAVSAEVGATPAPVLANQTITFDLGASVAKLATDAPFADGASASSGLPVAYSSDNTNVATVNASTGVVTIVSSGTAHILANQAGNGSFHPAPEVSQELIVSKVGQTITFVLGTTVSKHWSDTSFADPAAASSGLPVTFSSDATGVATVDANTGLVTIVGPGTAHILADQAGNGIYNAAPQVSQTLTVGNIGAASSISASHIVFANPQSLVGAAVFGGAGTYDGIPFTLWSLPYTTAKSLGSGVSVVAGGFSANTALIPASDGQYLHVAYAAGNVPGSLTFSGLETGRRYLVQIGFGDKRPGSFPYSVNATLTLSDASTTTIPLAIGAATTSDDYALITVTVSGTTSLKLDLPTASNGVGPLVAGISVHASPQSPTDLAAIAANHAVALSWTASPGATGYHVKRSTTSGAGYTTVGTTSGTSYNDGGLTNGTPYFYVVSASNDLGESVDSSEVGATPIAILADQTITFALGTNVTKLVTDAPFADTATATSGLPVTYSSDDTNVATVNPTTGEVTLVGGGVAHIRADQAGNASFNPAPQVSQELIVDKVDQTVAFTLGAAVSKHISEISYANPATASSGLPVTYSSDDTNVATVDANTGVVTIVGPGTVTILADQAGNGIYNTAQVWQTLTVGNVGAASSNSASPIVFDNSWVSVGAAVFDNAGTYDGIPFSLWSAPYTTAKSLGSGVSVVAGGFNNSTGLGLATDGQYRQVAYTSTNGAGSLTFSGLDSNAKYRFQFAFCDRRVGVVPYHVNATLTLSDASTGSVPLSLGATPTADDYALLTVTVSGSTSLTLNLPRAGNGVGPIVGGFSVHRFAVAGSYAAWAGTHAGGQAADLDYDNDGVPNGVEYFIGAPDGFTSTPALVNTAGVMTWTWPRDPAATATYLFQVSENLTDWTDVVPPNTSIDTTNPNQVIFTLPSGATRKFCRFVVTPAP